MYELKIRKTQFGNYLVDNEGNIILKHLSWKQIEEVRSYEKKRIKSLSTQSLKK